MPKVEIYTTPTCPYCHAAKALLSDKHVAFEEVTVLDPALRAKMTQRAGGCRTVPQVFVGATHVGGYEDLAALERQGRLDGLLAEVV